MCGIKKDGLIAKVYNAVLNGGELENDSRLFELRDETGKGIIVDTESGDVYKEDRCNNYRRYVNGTDGHKCDFYTVSIFNYIDDEGKIKPYYIRQHILVALVCHTKEFEVMDNNSNIVVCHKNGKRWDNRPANLEWGTSSENNKQGKMAASLQYHYPGTYTDEVIRVSISKQGEEITNKCITLKKEIRNCDIKTFESPYFKGDLKISKENNYYSKETVDKFIVMMKNYCYW